MPIDRQLCMAGVVGVDGDGERALRMRRTAALIIAVPIDEDGGGDQPAESEPTAAAEFLLRRLGDGNLPPPHDDAMAYKKNHQISSMIVPTSAPSTTAPVTSAASTAPVVSATLAAALAAPASPVAAPTSLDTPRLTNSVPATPNAAPAPAAAKSRFQDRPPFSCDVVSCRVATCS